VRGRPEGRGSADRGIGLGLDGVHGNMRWHSRGYGGTFGGGQYDHNVVLQRHIFARRGNVCPGTRSLVRTVHVWSMSPPSIVSRIVIFGWPEFGDGSSVVGAFRDPAQPAVCRWERQADGHDRFGCAWGGIAWVPAGGTAGTVPELVEAPELCSYQGTVVVSPKPAAGSARLAPRVLAPSPSTAPSWSRVSEIMIATTVKSTERKEERRAR